MKSPAYYLRTAIVCLAVFVAGCSQDSDRPVYDTAKNLDGFPRAALALIDDIESQRLSDYESIALRFETLYGEHMELLDNRAWAGVILRLGDKFRVWADSLAGLGPETYYRAGGLYALASFARPDERETRDLKDLFETWREAVEAGPPASLFHEPTARPSMKDQIELAKAFVLSDSLHRAFATRYVLGRLFRAGDTNWVRPEFLQQLRAADQAFLDYAGVADFAFETPLARFDSGRIELIDCLMTPVEGSRYRVEAYFIPRDSISKDIGVVFRIQSPDATPYTVSYDGREWIPYDFSLLRPSTEWLADSVAVAVETLYYEGEAAPAVIGLMTLDQANPRPVPLDGSEEPWFELPRAVFPETAVDSIR